MEKTYKVTIKVTIQNQNFSKRRVAQSSVHYNQFKKITCQDDEVCFTYCKHILTVTYLCTVHVYMFHTAYTLYVQRFGSTEYLYVYVKCEAGPHRPVTVLLCQFTLQHQALDVSDGNVRLLITCHKPATFPSLSFSASLQLNFFL